MEFQDKDTAEKKAMGALLEQERRGMVIQPKADWLENFWKDGPDGEYEKQAAIYRK